MSQPTPGRRSKEGPVCIEHDLASNKCRQDLGGEHVRHTSIASDRHVLDERRCSRPSLKIILFCKINEVVVEDDAEDDVWASLDAADQLRVSRLTQNRKPLKKLLV